MSETEIPIDEPAIAPGEPCGLFRRGLIMLYDLMPVLAIVFIATFIALPVTGPEVQTGRDPLFTGYVLAAWFAYLGLCWNLSGQTLGMRAWRVDLVTTNGGKLGWGRSLGRFLASLLSCAALGVGFWISLFRQDRACWHDLVTGTRLVRRPADVRP